MSGALPTDGPELSEYRPLLLSIAYRMLGSVAEAEDIVQEASLRFHNVRKEGTVIESPEGLPGRD
jgi:DNA-directed RNA polymerase specialized sigma24 family protein